MFISEILIGNSGYSIPNEGILLQNILKVYFQLMKNMAHSRDKKLVEVLQGDLRSLSNETKRKYPPVKEASEAAILKIRTISATCGEGIDHLQGLQKSCSDLLQPFLMGCDTKSLMITQLCLTSMQRLINYEIVDPPSAKTVVNILWQVYDQGIEELQLRLLQTSLVVLTSKKSSVSGVVLSKALVLCFRLHFTKNEVTNHTAEATIRQVVAMVFDRITTEDTKNKIENWKGEPYHARAANQYSPPDNATPAVCDGYMLLQDLCQLVNADSPHWLIGITEMTRTFGLELLETVLRNYQSIFDKHPEFKFLLKDRVCSLVIKLFSPNIKHGRGVPLSSAQAQEKPFFPISMRLLRVVSVLLKTYYYCLNTESEIFLSLLLKFLDTDKPFWQRPLAIEILYQLSVHPKLFKLFFCSIDTQTRNVNKALCNLVSSLGSFIQNLMASHSTNVASVNGETNNGISTTANSSLTCSPLSLEYKGILIPLMPVGFANNNNKNMYIEMLDKVEPPPIVDGYILGLAFYAFLGLVEALTSTNKTISEDEQTKNNNDTDEKAKELLSDIWCDVLSILSLLLDSCTDGSTTGSVLKCIDLCAGLCGHLALTPARDAFITVLCKACFPVYYSLPVFNSSLACLPQRIVIGPEHQQVLNDSLQQQVVAMGQSLVSSNNHTSVLLTAKNLQCMQAVLNLALYHGSVLSTAWQIVLTTLQHLVWILGLKPTSTGKMRSNPRLGSETGFGNNTVLTTAVLTDLPLLSAKLSEVFEASKDLDDVALHHLINALCSLSLEAMDVAYNNGVKEPSLFAIAKLLETGLVNMSRIEILWRPISGHLLEVCQHSNPSLREWGAECVTSLVKSAINFKHDILLTQNPRMLHMFLHPLKQLCSITHTDVRQRQLDSVLQILHSSGDLLSSGWCDILYIVESPTETLAENLIRTGFRSLQLIVSDFLPSLPCQCLKSCIGVITRYGLQTQDFNISLTAIGLLWSISDFIFQNRDKIKEGLSDTSISESLTMDDLWLDLFVKISELCIDCRPAVRKSAGQTLFSTISTHGTILVAPAWEKVIWDVLFTLMNKVQDACNSASKEKSEATILMHHSRDTAQKQWQETLVLTLAGLSRVFKLKQSFLANLQSFPKAWGKLFTYIENAALCTNSEVSSAALCSFEDVLQSESGSSYETINTQIWEIVWETWCHIGRKVTEPPSKDIEDMEIVISQAYLTSYVSLFCMLHEHLLSKFSLQDFKKLVEVLDNLVVIPVRYDAAAFELPSLSSFHLTPLQNVVMRCINLVQKNISSESDEEMYPAIFQYLLRNVKYATEPPSYGRITDKLMSNGKHKWLCPNCKPFAEYSLGLTVELYKKTACHKSVIHHNVITAIIRTLKILLEMRYDYSKKSTWVFAVDALVHVTQIGMPIVRQYSQSSYFNEVWDELYYCIKGFLFPPLESTFGGSVEEYEIQEKLDVKVVQLIKEDILPHNSSIPRKFVSEIIELLDRGSSYFANQDNTKIQSYGSREGLRQECFKTLKKYSLLKSPKLQNDGADSNSCLPPDVTGLSLETLVKQCRSSLLSYLDHDRLTLHYPMSQARTDNTIKLLQFLDTLLSSLCEETPNNDNKTFWKLFRDLYPVLVNCISCSSPELRTWIAKLLLHYRHFINIDAMS